MFLVCFFHYFQLSRVGKGGNQLKTDQINKPFVELIRQGDARGSQIQRNIGSTDLFVLICHMSAASFAWETGDSPGLRRSSPSNRSIWDKHGAEPQKVESSRMRETCRGERPSSSAVGWLQASTVRTLDVKLQQRSLVSPGRRIRAPTQSDSGISHAVPHWL